MYVGGYSYILIIDVQQKNPLNVIDDILSCDKIISSSLHGLIVADAYRVPSIWIEFSDKIVGNGFKFFDYFLSVNRKDNAPVKINSTTQLDDILKNFYDYEIEIDLEKLRKSCPF
ncbi:polysaccharide pyruvyl transferase family protein [Belliella baltica]|uniref:polysaccharide pyruvyl transferase family protein n=1 Tax=Belliella baltica TaxID=232259 RepID=UPI0006943060|nr:polysaccharide pyruvyl transferase family protein [Belliella baltica]